MPEATTVPSTGKTSGFGATQRTDNWWAGPLATALGLGGFGIYATFRVFHGHYTTVYDGDHVVSSTYLLDWAGWGELLSPFYSPLLIFPWLPVWFSPAFLILWAPGGFRATCYYYRKAYYRSMFQDPTACAVDEAQSGPLHWKNYGGETRFPFILQNLHRYFMYLALAFLVVLAIDVIRSTIGPEGGFRLSVGTLVLAINTTLLSLYTFSCHSLRHLIGGNVDCYSCVALGDARHKLWKGASKLNENHMLWAWMSLFGVGFADFYVWMVASGTWTDFVFIG